MPLKCHSELSEGSAKILLCRFLVASPPRMTDFKQVSNIEVSLKRNVAPISDLVESLNFVEPNPPGGRRDIAS